MEGIGIEGKSKGKSKALEDEKGTLGTKRRLQRAKEVNWRAVVKKGCRHTGFPSGPPP